jgi:hypothetical protein
MRTEAGLRGPGKDLSRSNISALAQSSILCFVLCAMLIALCVSAEAQQPAPLRIGWISNDRSSGESPFFEAFRDGMRALGYVEGMW